MKPAARARSWPAPFALLSLLLPFLVGAAWHLSDSSSQLARPRGYAQAAELLRRRDCGGALQAVDALASSATSQDAVFAQLAGGLYAQACGQAAAAEARLQGIRAPGGLLEDWRLYQLARAAEDAGHAPVAEAALAQLLGSFPASPLRGKALLSAARLASTRGDVRRALDIAADARRRPLPGSDAAALEQLAWEVGAGDAEARAAAARRLLIDFPAKAAELGVIEGFRAFDGQVDWAGLLTAGELERRARALLDANLADNAAATLSFVPPGRRDLDWSLLRAEALTRGRHGFEAYGELAGLTAGDPKSEAALEWARFRAADDAATVRRGSSGPTAAERADFRQRARAHLLRVVQLGGDPGLSKKALRELFARFTEEEQAERALAALRELRRLDPRDDAGTTYLWAEGWQEYGRANYTGAVGWWTELVSIYPDEPSARSARYWTARAFERLGEAERSRQIYREVASGDVDDFYRRNALAHLGEKVTSESNAVPGLWPSDPTLERARLLSDFGLDDLAQTELDLIQDRAPRRPLAALRAVILARQGDRRRSVVAIRDAFPTLGGSLQASVPAEAQYLYYPIDFQAPVESWSRANQLPAHLVYGMIRQESSFDLHASSWAGAQGLMQLMPSTARELARRLGVPYSAELLHQPENNIQLGTAYFRQVLGMFDGNVELALAGYNAGPNRIKRLWRDAGAREIDSFVEGLPIEEPRIYVKRILILSDSYRRLYNAG